MFRIAFFGSDGFSLSALKAVLALQRRRPEHIERVTLVTRRLKPSGRGMKNVVEPPVVGFARQAGVAWREAEDAHEFAALADVANLAVAVSYGRLVPASLLQRLPFGGLNVHPSLLPQYRGASPIQYAIMDRQRATGVSVQTLHPSKFDHGQLLWQSPEVVMDARETTPTLTARLGELGAAALADVLDRAALPSAGAALPAGLGTRPASLAPVIGPELYKLDFSLACGALDARGRALGKLWVEQRVEQKKTKGGKLKGHPVLRLNLHDFAEVDAATFAAPGGLGDALGGVLGRATALDGTPVVALRCRDGLLGAARVTLQGFKTESAESYFANFEKRRLREILQ